LVLRGFLADDSAGLAVGDAEGVHGVKLAADEVGGRGESRAERAEEGLAGAVAEEEAGAGGHDKVISRCEDVLGDDGAVCTRWGWVRVGTLKEVVSGRLPALKAAESLETLVAPLEVRRNNVESRGRPLDDVVQKDNACLVALRGIGRDAGSVEAVLAVEALDADAPFEDAGSCQSSDGEDE